MIGIVAELRRAKKHEGKWSGREDLNLRPPQPHCAIERDEQWYEMVKTGYNYMSLFVYEIFQCVLLSR